MIGKGGLMSDSAWTFLTNHAHVLVCIHRDPDARLRDLAEAVGITERAVHRIVHDLSEEGYLEVSREGRRNHYRVAAGQHLRHPIEASSTVAMLLALGGAGGKTPA